MVALCRRSNHATVRAQTQRHCELSVAADEISVDAKVVEDRLRAEVAPHHMQQASENGAL